ncbi:MAG: tyrosine-type recombinase/integrase [Boseongicola sp.]|nr:tyrosine-type recombinase/integrase [Boseongicola sp.]
MTPHVIRHSCGCHLLRSGVDINTIRAWLGDVSLETTNIYVEFDLEAKEEAMKSTCPGDPGERPRWKAKGGLLEQLKAI